jgi:protein-S-isoprenylcysteine O-methyltransferase Ste14
MNDQSRAASRPEIRVPPLALAAATALLMAWAARMVPELQWKFPGRVALGTLVMLLGGVVALLGVREFRRARTTSNPLRPGAATALVDTGIFAWSRNPMYLGFAAALAGWALFLAHPLAMLVVPGFVLLMNGYQIEREEQALRALFGAAFDEYCGRVGRWLSFGLKKSQ